MKQIQRSKNINTLSQRERERETHRQRNFRHILRDRSFAVEEAGHKDITTEIEIERECERLLYNFF
jgi:hypothetical protein